MKILIMGLPGSGKTTLSEQIVNQLEQINKSVLWLNADKIRQMFNDWDFSHEGRIRQAKRMFELAEVSTADFVIADFVCPLEEMRTIFAADVVVWVDTLERGRFEDTNKIFESPERYDIRVTEQDSVNWADKIINFILTK